MDDAVILFFLAFALSVHAVTNLTMKFQYFLVGLIVLSTLFTISGHPTIGVALIGVAALASLIVAGIQNIKRTRP